MTSKSLAIYERPKLECVFAYGCDQLHPRHENVDVGAWMSFGIPGKMDFPEVVTDVEEQIARRNAEVKPGPETIILSLHVMTRTAPTTMPGAALDAVEICDMPIHIMRNLNQDRIVKGYYVPHLHPVGCVDEHFLLFAFWPHKPSYQLLIREACDQWHRELNAVRRAKGRPLLPTVEDARQAKFLEMGISPLAAQLAVAGLVDHRDLPRVLKAEGHSLGSDGVDCKTNRVAIIHPNLPDRVYNYSLSKLLDEVKRAQAVGGGGKSAALRQNVGHDNLLEKAEVVAPEMDI